MIEVTMEEFSDFLRQYKKPIELHVVQQNFIYKDETTKQDIAIWQTEPAGGRFWIIA